MTGTSPLPEALAERLAFLQLDSESLDRVRSLEAGVLRHLGPALDRFYERLAGQPDVAEFFSGSEQAERAKSAQLRHWSAIAGGQLDADYFESSNRIGRRHAQIGLAPNWYIGGYGLIAETIIKGLLTDFFDAQAAKPRGLFARRDEAAERQEVAEFGEAVAALIKSVMVDVDIAVTTYFDRLTAVAAEQQKASSDKIALAVTSVGEVLRQVAEGDLTARVTAALDPELEQIKVDTNAVADRLLAVMTRLRGASTALRTATGDILSGTTDLSDRTVRQAASVEQTSASLQQITGMVASNAERASAAEERIAAVVDLAGVGGREMNDATDAMQRISESTARITSITGLIDDIAFQTNLLALNASVEAARAGEAGKGFAVVAVEVRRLAQSAAAASQEIKSLIDASAGEVSSGTGLVTSAGETLRHILEEIRQCSELTRAIASSSREQAQAIHEINTAIREIDAGTQHNAALVEETNAAIEQTEQQAAELDGIVEMFRTEMRRPERRATAA